MLVCWHCLQAIESHEGHQIQRKLDYDDERQNDDGEILCEWCDELYEVSELYEI